MKKLDRFSILAVCFLTLTVLFYCIIPTLSWIFGGSFLAVAQHPMHVLFAGTLIVITLGIVFNECFDSNFYSKD